MHSSTMIKSVGKCVCLFLLIGLLFYFPIQAESAFEDRAGVRPLGMGGAFVARADDSSAVLWNPAGLAQLRQAEFIANYSALYTGLDVDESSLGRSYLGYTHPVSEAGTVGLNFIRLGTSLYNETTLYLSYSHALGPLHIGGNLKGLFTSFVENEYTAVDPLFQEYGHSTKDVGVDVGMLLKLGNLSLGVVGQNLNAPNLALEEGAESILPREIKGGLALKLGKVQPSVDVTWRDTKLRDKQDINAHLGVEAWVTQDIGVRTGMNFDELSAGASYRFHRPGGTFQLDYAFNYPLPFEMDLFDRGQTALKATSGSHQFALAVRFSDFRQLMGVKPSETSREVEPDIRVEINARSPEEVEASIATYQAIVRDDEANLDAHFWLGQLYASQKQYDDAIAHLKRTTSLASDEAKYHYTLAVVYEQFGDATGRKTWYNKAFITYQKTQMLDADYRDVSGKIEAVSKKMK